MKKKNNKKKFERFFIFVIDKSFLYLLYSKIKNLKNIIVFYIVAKLIYHNIEILNFLIVKFFEKKSNCYKSFDCLKKEIFSIFLKKISKQKLKKKYDEKFERFLHFYI